MSVSIASSSPWRPAALLAEQLAAARTRGEEFDAVWPAAVKAALVRVRAAAERREWFEVWAELKPVWRAGWERQPVGVGRLVGLLAEDRDLPADERLCRCCDGPIPEERAPSALYCSAVCKSVGRSVPLAAVA